MIPADKFSPDNTITVAVAIYKQNWKEYLKLSLIHNLALGIRAIQARMPSVL